VKVTRLLQLIANNSFISEAHCSDPARLAEYQPKAQELFGRFTVSQHFFIVMDM
jgi:hypothetical protein